MKIGTRGSELALWQARHVRALLQQAAAIDAELVIIKTTGDKDLDTPFVGMTGKGFFTKEIEEALLAGQVDLAVHSLKDLQTDMPPGLMLAAIPERADRRDILLIRNIAFAADRPLRLKTGAKVGTSSARRVAQLRFLRPDLILEPLRGNVPTRIRKLREGQYDAILAASAGIDRLELPLDEFHVYRLSEALVVPAPGQGALGLQIRDNDSATREIVSKLDAPQLRQIVYLEREILRRLEGGCQLALGTAAEKTKYGYRLSAFLGVEQADRPRRLVVNGTDAERIIQATVNYLKELPQESVIPAPSVIPLNAGIHEPKMDSRVQGNDDGGGRVKVWITREPERAGAFVDSLSPERFEVTPVPVFAAIEAGDSQAQGRAIANLRSYSWIIFTSQTTVREFRRLLGLHGGQLPGTTRLAAIGRKTAKALEDVGWKADFVGDAADATSLAEQFAEINSGPIGRILFPCGRAANDDLEMGLATAGLSIDRLVCYDMLAHPDMPLVLNGLPDPNAIVFTSPQAARFLLAERPLAKATLTVSIGPATSEALLSLGSELVYEAFDRSLEGIAEVIDGLFAV